jgi:hypothetical protein
MEHHVLFALLVLLRALATREHVLHAAQIHTHRWPARSLAQAAMSTPLDVHLQLPEFVQLVIFHQMVTVSVVLHVR